MSKKQNSKSRHKRSESFSSQKSAQFQKNHRIFVQNADKGLNIQALVKESEQLQHSKVNIVDDLKDQVSTNPEMAEIGKQKLLIRLRNDFLYPQYKNPLEFSGVKVGNCWIPYKNNKMKETRDPLSKNFNLINKMIDIQDDLTQLSSNKYAKYSQLRNKQKY